MGGGGSGRMFYIPHKELVDSDDKQVNLKEVFKKHNICPNWWHNEKEEEEEKMWQETSSRLTERAAKEKKHYMIASEELPNLLLDAKTIIKSFLITNDNDLPRISDDSTYNNDYFKKSGINRLFTYAELERVIKQKSLTHVRLPKKILVLQDRKTENYISSEKSPEIIDDILKFYVTPAGNISIGYDYTQYDLIIFAQRERNFGGFNKVGRKELLRKELFMLCEDAPFDIGYDNIFCDDKGNAVIIDTEYKDAVARQACPKLDRYFE
jgi:hypothetical protein